MAISAVSDKTIERLSLYRRAILRKPPDWGDHIFSHQMAAVCGVSAAQVRRDLMAIGYTGSPQTGYELTELYEAIGRFMDAPAPTRVAIVGVGHLGRAVISFLINRRPSLVMAAAFDSDPSKTDRVQNGVPCYPIARLKEVVADLGIEIAIVAVPAGDAQRICDLVVEAGIRGILNFAPAFLQLPKDVVVERLDVTVALEKVAYLTRTGTRPKRKTR